jgi:hypothetical protein
MAISPHIPIFKQGDYSYAKDFFQGYFHYGKDRYEYLPPDQFPEIADRDFPIRHERISQPLWLIVLKVISIVTIILPIIGLFALLDNQTLRKHQNLIIKLDPQGQNRVAEVEKRYQQYKKEIDRVNKFNPKRFKDRLDRFKTIEIALEKGGTPGQVYQRVIHSLGRENWFFHGENVGDIKAKKMVNGRQVELTLEEKKEFFVNNVKNELGVLHILIDRTSMEEVMKACELAAPCLQGTMTALQNLMGELNNIGFGNQNVDPNKNVEDLIPQLATHQNAEQRTSALLQVFLRQQADAQLKAEEKPNTPDIRGKLAGDERFQKIHFNVTEGGDAPEILEWMERNRYVGAVTTKFTHHNIPNSVYTREIARETLFFLYRDVLALQDVELEEVPVEEAILEAEQDQQLAGDYVIGIQENGALDVGDAV